MNDGLKKIAQDLQNEDTDTMSELLGETNTKTEKKEETKVEIVKQEKKEITENKEEQKEPTNKEEWQKRCMEQDEYIFQIPREFVDKEFLEKFYSKYKDKTSGEYVFNTFARKPSSTKKEEIKEEQDDSKDEYYAQMAKTEPQEDSVESKPIVEEKVEESKSVKQEQSQQVTGDDSIKITIEIPSERIKQIIKQETMNLIPKQEAVDADKVKQIVREVIKELFAKIG